jgi:serine/threonine protein kinase
MPSYRYKKGDRPLDGYTIEYALGRGGFGEVYFATSDSGREVALKAVQNYEDVELRGISHCMNLKSPYLVTIFDVRYGQGNVPWVIMEYVAGPSLHELMAQSESESGLGEDQAMYFVRELIMGLRYLHDAGVVHRDLKPHNIFFEDGAVKIGDYSLSKAISSSQQTGHTTTVGSVHYMAPEIGEGKYDKAVDIYALGVILFEMLTGSPPYVGESMGEVLIKHLTGEPDVSGISQPFAKVIQKAMQRDPDDRYANVDEMLLALCPEDQSSYLPPPLSLTMIGDRAVQRRTKQGNAAGAIAGRSQMEDTFLPENALVDTKEHDSLPFSRPGVPVPTLHWLETLGLWWRPTGLALAKQDSSSWVMRWLLVFGCSGILGAFGATQTGTPGYVVLLLFLALPVVASIITWAMLQFLPRTNEVPWAISSRLSTLVIVLIASILLANVIEMTLGARLFKEEMLLGLLCAGALIDGRCFISADRYPRVGLWRTVMALVMFSAPACLADSLVGNRYELVASLGCVSAVVVSIQLLAPMHVRLVNDQTNKGSRHGPKDVTKQADGDQARSDIEVNVVQEQV